MSTQQVVIHLESQILTGSLKLPEKMGLLEYLNLDFIHQDDKVSPLELNYVRILYPDGKQGTANIIYVNREDIQILRTLLPQGAELAATRTKRFVLPFLRKFPVRALIHMPGYELQGCIYCAPKQTITQLLAETLSFIPCIASEIQNIRGDNIVKDSFIILNKKQVKSIDCKTAEEPLGKHVQSNSEVIPAGFETKDREHLIDTKPSEDLPHVDKVIALAEDRKSEILKEIEANLAIATETRTNELESFQTSVWEAKCSSKPDYSLSDIRFKLTEAYVDMALANRIVRMSSEFGLKNTDLEESYLKLCKNIAENLQSTIPLISKAPSIQ